MVMIPVIGKEFVGWTPPSGTDDTFGYVDFSIVPHLDHPDMPGNSIADAENWAANLAVPAYAIGDETAIKVVDGHVDVVSEGNWKHFPR